MKIVPPFGPLSAEIALVGEAPGEKEEALGVPFIGASGEELSRILEDAGLRKSACYLTNAIKVRPPNNELDRFLVKKPDLPEGYAFPAITHGKYLHPDYLPFIHELREELLSLRPNVIVALGNTALWALTGRYGIASARGVVVPTPYGKVIPTYHPAALFRQWNLRAVTVADFQKVKYESTFPEVRRPIRYLLVKPTYSELINWLDEHIHPAKKVAADVETKGGTITCLSLAPSAEHSCSIPFFDPTKPDGNYWSFEEELAVWKRIKHHLLRKDIKRLFQNGLYDAQYLLKHGIKIPSIDEDTMLKHHAMYPESPKGLGYLGSVYTNELSWKGMAKEIKDK